MSENLMNRDRIFVICVFLCGLLFPFVCVRACSKFSLRIYTQSVLKVVIVLI